MRNAVHLFVSVQMNSCLPEQLLAGIWITDEENSCYPNSSLPGDLWFRSIILFCRDCWHIPITLLPGGQELWEWDGWRLYNPQPSWQKKFCGLTKAALLGEANRGGQTPMMRMAQLNAATRVRVPANTARPRAGNLLNSSSLNRASLICSFAHLAQIK